MTEKKRQPTTTAPPGRVSQPRRIQNFLVVWLDANIDEVNDEDCQNTVAKLNAIVKDINIYTDVDECVNFIRSVKKEKVFLISSGDFGQRIVPTVSDMSQVSTIYIFCGNQARHEIWTKDWPKVEAVFTEIEPICEALKKATLACDQNFVAISFVAPTAGKTGQSLDQLDQTFMNTQLLKEILLTIDFDESHIQAFIKSSRALLANDVSELKNVDKLEREYDKHSPIWWYTYQSFLYSTLNRALRLMEVDLIVSMGFFVRHLHEHIATLHKEQYGGHTSSPKFIIFRGQGLTQSAFDQMMKVKGGLLSFNNFLSTSTNREVSLDFARETMTKCDLGVLFVLNIDATVSSTPFARVRDVSAIPCEEEILFSMHSIFRIEDIKQVDGNKRLWEVDLTLTSDDDLQLRALTDSIRDETAGHTGWERLGKLMIKLGQLDQAEELFYMLLEQEITERRKAPLYNMLGLIKQNQGKYAEAITFCEKSITIREEILSPTDPELVYSYNNIGGVYNHMKEYSKALGYYEKTLVILEDAIPLDQTVLATLYNNIGTVQYNLGEFSKALEFYEKVFEIQEEVLPANHPNLAMLCNNIGSVYLKMGENSKALEYYEKTLAIYEKSLPSNHPLVATSCSNIGVLHFNMNKYVDALAFFDRALAIKQRVLPASHPSLQTTKNWIEDVKKKL